MKFRVSSKDLIIFSVFCLILLYLCAIAVLNFVSFGNTGQMAGLNPFPAFAGKYLPATLIMFIISLVLIFTGVSSYIFDKEKGGGFGLKIGEKNEKGYSRWAKEKEIKESKNIEMVIPTDDKTEAAGIPLINDGKKIWVDNGESHSLIIGSSGSGKTETIVKPMVNLLAKHSESMIINDPKGEIYHYSAEYLKRQGYKIVLLNFREPQNGNAWNPLTLPYQYYKSGNTDKATELLDDVALNILYDPNNKGEPFWEKSAADYFSGLTLGLFEDAKIEEINLNSINYMSTVGEEKFGGATNYAKEYFNLKGEASNAYVFASNTINAPAETKGGILSVFRQKIRLFASRENLSEMLSYSDFDMRDIGRQKTAVFIVIHDEKTTYHSLATIFIKQCYETLIDVAQENGGKLPFRTNFILDEFSNMPPLKDIDSMVSAARSRLIRFTLIIQNYAQLNDVYGKEVAEVIKGNCGNIVYLITTELSALEEISKMCGEVKSGEKDKTASTPLVTVSDLQKMKLFELIIKRLRTDPFKTKLTPDFEMDWGIKRELASYPNRDKKEVKLFDLKSFVKEKKRQKMLESLDNPSGDSKSPNKFDNPFAVPNPIGKPSSPFGGGSNPFAPEPSGFNNPFDLPKPATNPFGGGGNIDLDAVMKDIDRKIAELDAEEARQKEMLAQKKKEEENHLKQQIEEEKKVETVTIDTKIEEPSVKIPDGPLTGYNIFDTKPVAKEELPKEKKTIEIPAAVPDIESIQEEKPLEDPPVVSSIPKTVIDKTNIEEDEDNTFKAIPDPIEFKEDSKTIESNLEKTQTIVIPESQNDILNNLENANYNIYNKEIEKTLNTEPEIKYDKPEPKKLEEQKPKINVDVDSVIVKDNIITDDEFFDDFFGDD